MLKNSEFSQFARTSDSGLRTTPATANDLGTELLADRNGRLWVNVDGYIPPPVDPFPNAVNINVLGLSGMGRVGAARIGSLAGYSRGIGIFPAWLHMLDIAAPPPGSIPTVVLPITANAQLFSYAIPYVFSTALTILLSSTEQTLTVIPGATMNLSGVIYTQ
jgi:hypothetical protein